MWFSLLHSKLGSESEGWEKDRHRGRACREASARSAEQGTQSSCEARYLTLVATSAVFLCHELRRVTERLNEVPYVDKSLAQSLAPDWSQ